MTPVHREAAVDRKRHTKHEAPAGAAEPEHGRGHLVRSTESLIPHELLHGVGPLWSISATTGVSIVPGHTAMMRTALEAYSSAALFVRPITPCLDAW